MGDEIVAQALEVARVEAEAELAQAEADLATEQRNIASEETAHAQAGAANEVALQIAEVQAERDIEVARVVAGAPHGCDAGCEYCSTKFSELESKLSEHIHAMEIRMVKLEARARPEQQEVKKIHVQKPFEKPRPKKPAAQVNGGLYFGR